MRCSYPVTKCNKGRTNTAYNFVTTENSVRTGCFDFTASKHERANKRNHNAGRTQLLGRRPSTFEWQNCQRVFTPKYKWVTRQWVNSVHPWQAEPRGHKWASSNEVCWWGERQLRQSSEADITLSPGPLFRSKRTNIPHSYVKYPKIIKEQSCLPVCWLICWNKITSDFVLQKSLLNLPWNV